MKKFLFLSILSISSTFLFCQEIESENNSDIDNLFYYEDDNFKKVDEYLDKNFSSVKYKFLDADLISDEIDLLSEEQKAELYEKHSRSSALYFGINMVGASGIGSLVQGDVFGGTLALTTGIIGCTLGVIGFYGLAFNVYVDLWAGIIKGLSDNKSDSNSTYTIWHTMMIIGGAFYLTGLITAIIRPFAYANNLNKELKKILKIDDAKITVAPVITTNKSTGVYVGLALKI